MLNKPNQRRASGNMPIPYDRQPPFTEPVPPGPPAPFPYFDNFDRYGPEDPPQPPLPFRPPVGNDFAPGYWRHTPFAGPSTPDRYRPPSVDSWPRPGTWKEPEPAPWPDGSEAPQPYTPQWNRPMRDGAPTRMFEPSDTWKQTHGELNRGRDHHSPSQPVSTPADRYRPYALPLGANRPRMNYTQISRPELHRLPHNDTEHWSPDDAESYDNGARDLRATAYSTCSTTPDRMDGRFRGPDGDERSVSPVSPRGIQHSSSPGFGAVPKRESPELPHLEALSSSRKAGPSSVSQPPRGLAGFIPPKPLASRSPSHSSTASSVNLPHVQQLQVKSGLPSKPQFSPKPRFSGQLPHRMDTKSPPLQISSIAPLNDLSTPREEPSLSGPVPPPQPPATDASKPVTQGQGRNNVRRPFNAPSFVPSTLAIDAPLMYPSRLDAGTGKGSIAKAGDAKKSDIRVPLPAPIAKVAHEAELESVRSNKPHPELQGSTSDNAHISTVSNKPIQEGEEDFADASDMEMSPPASPLITPLAFNFDEIATEKLRVDRAELVHPSLAIDTSLTLPHLALALPRQSESASPVPMTPEQVAEDTGGDDSDMDMSSPVSETAGSPPPFMPLPLEPIPALSHSQKPATVEVDSQPSNLMQHASSVVSRPEATPSPLAVARLLDHHIVEQTDVDTTHSRASTPPTVETDAPQTSARSNPPPTGTATLDEPLVEAEPAELSPPISDKTLQGEMEGAEKDHVRTIAQPEEAAVQPKEMPMVVDEPAIDKVMTQIPLSDALRMVARLRFHYDIHTEDARVEPILFSNRQIAEPEVTSAQSPEMFVQSITEKEQQHLSNGYYDGTKHALRRRFAQHQLALVEKVERLRKEYLVFHEKWLVHCAKLDDVQRANALEEAAATAGRTTRRTAAMGDAVRSDLEMEQILASLGSEELTDANHLSQKNAAVVPDMVSVTKGRVEYVYDDTNALVEDPHEFYRLETGIDDWTDQEKAILVEKYAVHPKQFGIIAESLPHKTPAQCVTFYYLHKNTTIDFRKAIALHNTLGKRRRSGRNGKQKGNALLADILKHDDEVSRDSTPNATGRRKRGAAPSSASTPVPPSSSVDTVDPTKRPSLSWRGTAQNTPAQTPDPEPAPNARRPRRRVNPSARAAAAMEQDGNEDAADDDVRPSKRTRKSRRSKAERQAEASGATALDETALTSVDGKLAEQLDSIVRKKVPGSGSSWSEEDRALFLKLLAQHGDDFKRIASAMANKTTVQVSAFYRANVTEMELAKVAAKAPKRSPTPQENGSQSASAQGTGVVVPGTGNVLVPLAVSRSRSGGRMSSPPNPDGAQSSETDKQTQMPTTSSDRAGQPQQLYPPAQLHYEGGLASAVAGPSRSSGFMGMSMSPPTLTIKVPPPLAYSNLGPLNFTGDPQQRSSSHGAAALPVGPCHSGNNAAMTFEFSEFAPQPWQVAGLTRPGFPPAPVQSVGGTTSLPATLETTDDLVRYLEHRTRLTAGQHNDSDFM